MSRSLQHLVFIRHGESEGDLRRAAWRRGETFVTDKLPEDEEITAKGIEQCRYAGAWIVEHILKNYNLAGFDGNFVSLSIRSLQSAIALNIGQDNWQGDERLNERNRGRASGLTPRQHREQFPDSFATMNSDPLHWQPPGGNSIIDVLNNWRGFHEDVKYLDSVIVVGHRDQMWAAMKDIENLTDEELLAVNTDNIHNGQVVHYTSIDPSTGEAGANLAWVRSIDPAATESVAWTRLPNVPID
jgi:broad specificity phosphatase PhoE